MEVYPNYMGHGKVRFETQLESGYYILELFNKTTRFKLYRPNNGALEGSVNWLRNEINYFHADPELINWITNCIGRESETKNDSPKKEFIVNGVKYSYKANPRTGDITLFFPRQIIVSSFVELTEHYPELELILDGYLMELIDGVLEENNTSIEDTPNHKEYLPIRFCNTKEYVIKDALINIGVHPKRKIIFLDISETRIDTHADSIYEDVPYLLYINNGAYEKVLMDQLADECIWVS